MWRLLIVGLAVSAPLSCDPAEEAPPFSEGCTDCIDLRTVVRLDFSSAPTLPSPGGLLAHSPGSGIWTFVDVMVPHEVLVFDSSGAFSRVIGREGTGPGEFEDISAAFFDAADTLWVVSRRGSRIDLYSPELEWTRGMSIMTRISSAVPMSDGRVLAVASAQGRAQLSLILRDGSIEPVLSPTLPPGPPQLFALASDGAERFWVAEPHSYRVWMGALDGDASLLADEPPGWFAEDFSEEIKAEFSGLIDTNGATILSLAFDPETGVIWIVSAVPSSDLEADFLRSVFSEMEAAALKELPAQMVDHVVHGVEAGSGIHHADGRFDYLGLRPGQGLLYEVATDAMVHVLQPFQR